MPGTIKPKRASRKWSLFACGALAPLSVYVIFYAKHAEAFVQAVGRCGAFQCGLAARR